MALYPCRECRTQVGGEAPTCPKCGTPWPAHSEDVARRQMAASGGRGGGGAVGAGTIAKGVFGGILGCIVAPIILMFVVLALAVGAAGG